DLGVDYWQYSDPLSHITNTVLTQAAAPDPFGSPGFFQGALDSPGTVGSTSTTKDSPSRMPATPDSWFGAKRKSSAGIVHAGSSAIGGIAGMSPASMITNGVGTIGMIGLGVGIGIGIGMGSLGVSAVTSVSPAPLVGNILQPQSPEKLAAVTGAVAQMMRGGNTNGVPAMNEIVGQVQDVAVSEMQMVIDKGVVARFHRYTHSNVTTTTPNTPTTMQLVPQVVTNGTADVVQQPAVSIANAANGAPVYPSPPDNLPDSVGISFDVDSLYNMSGTSAWNGDNYGDLDTLEITDDDWDFFDRVGPSGSIATLLSPNTLASPHDPAAVLREWSTFFGIPISKLKTTTVNSNIGRGSRANTPVPLLVPIKTATETLLYPSALIFISTPIKRSCNGVAGTTGLSANNSGLVEELGDKIDRWAWEDRIVEITSKKSQMGVGGGAPSNGNDAPATAGTKRTSDGADLMDAEFQPAKRVKIEPGQEGGEIAHVVGGGPGINPVHENIHPAPDLGVDYWQYSDPLSHITNTVLTQAAAPDPFGSPGFFQGALD
ncbi:hypothetical protein BC936DRAFT_143427, partial [Jimgerdemannia flammicorona]